MHINPEVYSIIFFTKYCLEDWYLYIILRTIDNLSKVSHLHRLSPTFWNSRSLRKRFCNKWLHIPHAIFVYCYMLVSSADMCTLRSYHTPRFVPCGLFASGHVRMVLWSSLVLLCCPTALCYLYPFSTRKVDIFSGDGQLQIVCNILKISHEEILQIISLTFCYGLPMKCIWICSQVTWGAY